MNHNKDQKISELYELEMIKMLNLDISVREIVEFNQNNKDKSTLATVICNRSICLFVRPE